MSGHRRLTARTLVATGLLAAGLIARARYRNWGATPDEQRRALPGDELIPDPARSITRAVDVGAPAEVVWRWLVQIGQDRGGMYSYDWLENAIGLGIHSAVDIRAEWQQLAPGDRVVVVPAGWGPLREGYSFPVAAVEHGRSLVLRQSPPEHPWNAVWTFAIEPLGPERCRLISRSRSESRRNGAGLALSLATEIMEPITLVMTRGMLLGIKARAEASRPCPGSATA